MNVTSEEIEILQGCLDIVDNKLENYNLRDPTQIERIHCELDCVREILGLPYSKSRFNK